MLEIIIIIRLSNVIRVTLARTEAASVDLFRSFFFCFFFLSQFFSPKKKLIITNGSYL